MVFINASSINFFFFTSSHLTSVSAPATHKLNQPVAKFLQCKTHFYSFVCGVSHSFFFFAYPFLILFFCNKIQSPFVFSCLSRTEVYFYRLFLFLLCFVSFHLYFTRLHLFSLIDLIDKSISFNCEGELLFSFQNAFCDFLSFFSFFLLRLDSQVENYKAIKQACMYPLSFLG